MISNNKTHIKKEKRKKNLVTQWGLNPCGLLPLGWESRTLTTILQSSWFGSLLNKKVFELLELCSFWQENLNNFFKYFCVYINHVQPSLSTFNLAMIYETNNWTVKIQTCSITVVHQRTLPTQWLPLDQTIKIP